MRRLDSKDGVALILVLWAIVILSFLLLSLTEEIQLESYLTRNLLEQTQLQHIAQAGIARGIAALEGDQTIVDGRTEIWLAPIIGEIEDQGIFEVTIEDIGSKFNMNYIGFPILDQLVPTYVEEFKEWRLKEFPFFIQQDIEQFPNSEDFESTAQYMSFYGKFNITIDDLEVLKALMVQQDIAEWTAESVVQELGQIEEPITSLDELLLHIPSMDTTTFNAIRDELTVTGNLNINLVDEGVLVALAESLKIDQDLIAVILEAREREVILDFKELEDELGAEDYHRLAAYFDVKSSYFRITCTARSNNTSLEKTIVVEVERNPERVSRDRVLEWSMKILSWVES